MIIFPATFIQPQASCVPVAGLNVQPQTGTYPIDYVPMDTWYRYNFSACLYLASEIGSGEKQINGIQWQFGASIPSFTRPNITVKLYHTTDSVIPASPSINLESQMNGVTGLTKVLDNGTMTISGSNGNFSTLFTFEENFCYNGTDNLILQVEDRSNQLGTNYSNMWEGATNTPTNNRGCWGRSDDSYNLLTPLRGNFRNTIKLLY